MTCSVSSGMLNPTTYLPMC